MQHKAVSWFPVFAVIGILVAPAYAAEVREVGKVEGWSIIHDPAGEGACYAKGTFGKETALTFGMSAPDAAWMAVVSNPALGQLPAGSVHEIRYVFGTKYVWSETALATPEGMRSGEIGEEFVDDFARASSMKLVFQGQTIDSFKLAGNRDVVAAIRQCYVTYMQGVSRYVPDEPAEARQSP
jgi:hypothetical protein